MITVYVDMDSVLANFDSAIYNPSGEWIEDPPEMFEPMFFRNLPVMPGSSLAVSKLMADPNIDLYIATKPSTKNVLSATEKYQWVEEHFPALLRKMFLTCDKSKLKGDYLIDDDLKWSSFDGEFIHFNTKADPETEWKRITDHLTSSEKQLSLF